MAKQTINTGTSPNARDGDPIRVAFSKVNQNFNELYTLIGADSDTEDIIKDAAADMLINGTHQGITVAYDNINKVISLSLTTSFVDIDGGSSSSLYTASSIINGGE
jgi:endo-1,4-beta-mannosidase